MKIKEVITEAGFFKGVAKAIAPQTIQAYDQQKNALRTPQTDGDPSMTNVASSTSNVATNISQVSATPTATSTSVNINKIQPAPKPGLPTPAEIAKLQQKIQAAEPAVTKSTGVYSPRSMKDIDTSLQDYNTLTPDEFQNAYGMTKQQWLKSYKGVLPTRIVNSA